MELYKVETHLHTSQGSARGYSTGAEMARAYKEKGYQAIIVTDHFFGGNTAVPRDLPWKEWVERFCAGYEDAKKAGDEVGIEVFFGWEWAWHGTEFLTYGLGKVYLMAHPEMVDWDIPTYLTNVRAAGAYVSHAHPFRQASYLTGAPRLIPEFTDAVEVYNCGNAEIEYNLKALQYAKMHGLAMTSGSDEHDCKKFRGGGMVFATPMHSIEDFIRAVRTQQPFEVLTGKEEGFPH